MMLQLRLSGILNQINNIHFRYQSQMETLLNRFCLKWTQDTAFITQAQWL